METNISYIYSLSSSANPELVRYIGKSTVPTERFIAHKNASKYKRTYKEKWINSELVKGNDIILDVLLCKPEDEIYKYEVDTIKLYKSFGAKLVNSNDGGLGGGNPSPEVREKIRLSKIGNQWNVGRKIKPHVIEALRNSRIGHTVSEETREKLRRFNTGRPYRPDVTKRKLSEEIILEIHRLKNEGNSLVNISEILNIKKTTLQSLFYCDSTYKDIKEKYKLNFKYRNESSETKSK